MKINPQQWQVFARSADEQECEHLDQMCTARRYVFCGDIDGRKPLIVQGCGNSVLFEIPYEGIVAGRTQEAVVACAVDDNLPMWPRFGGNAYAQERLRGDTINELDNYDWGDQLG